MDEKIETKILGEYKEVFGALEEYDRTGKFSEEMQKRINKALKKKD